MKNKKITDKNDAILPLVPLVPLVPPVYSHSVTETVYENVVVTVDAVDAAPPVIEKKKEGKKETY